MKYRREFEIAYVGLKAGEHNYSFEIGKAFFDLVEADSSEFEDVNIHIDLKFVKHQNFFELTFDVSGSVVVPCDRCGDSFNLPLWDEFDLVIKLKEHSGEEDEEDVEDDGDIVFMSKSETIIDLSEWIYEFILLSIPMQKIHPVDEAGNTTCNKDNLALLEKMQQQSSEIEEEAKEETKKNIWKGLDAFKDRDNN